MKGEKIIVGFCTDRISTSKSKEAASNLDLPIYPDLESLSIPKPPIRKNSSKRISHINLTISRRFEIMSHEHRRRHVMMMKS